MAELWACIADGAGIVMAQVLLHFIEHVSIFVRLNSNFRTFHGPYVMHNCIFGCGNR